MRAFCQRLYRWMFANGGKTALSLTILVAVVYLMIVFLVPQRPPYIVIDATTQFLRFVVTRPGLASIQILRGEVNDTLPNCSNAHYEHPKITARLQPEANVNVRYRWSKQAVVVDLEQQEGSTDRSGELIFSDGGRCDVPHSIFINLPNKSIFSEVETNLPIAGPAELGVELQEELNPGASSRASTLLLGGTVKVFGRPLLPHLKGNLYPAQGADFPLPAGGRLASGKSQTLSGASSDVPPWFGVARIGADGLNVSATTESNQLQFHRPGFSRDTETFAVGLVVRLFNDPSIAVLSVGLVVFSLVGQLVSAWIGIWRRPGATPFTPEAGTVEEMAPEQALPIDQPVDRLAENDSVVEDDHNVASETPLEKG